MKKLIFAAAAVAGMGAFALESANVVGYSATDYTTTGFKAYVGQFGGTDKQDAEMTLGDIKPNAVFEWGSDELQLLTTQGATDSVYYYAAPELAAENEMEAGWWLVDFGEPVEVANDVIVPFGSSVVLNIGTIGAGMVSSGEVKKGSPAIAVTQTGFNCLGNATPADCTLGDIVPNENLMWGDDELQTLAADGSTQAVYYYAAPELAAENEMEAGWWLVDFGEPVEVANSLPIAAGEGFLLNCASSGVELNMPQVLAAE